jgi:hypothetical protein
MADYLHDLDSVHKFPCDLCGHSARFHRFHEGWDFWTCEWPDCECFEQ